MQMKVTTLTFMRVNLIRFTPFKLKISTNTVQTGTQNCANRYITSQNNVYFKTTLFKSIILIIQIISRIPVCDLIFTLR